MEIEDYLKQMEKSALDAYYPLSKKTTAVMQEQSDFWRGYKYAVVQMKEFLKRRKNDT
jgi:hypothetical protein